MINSCLKPKFFHHPAGVGRLFGPETEFNFMIRLGIEIPVENLCRHRAVFQLLLCREGKKLAIGAIGCDCPGEIVSQFYQRGECLVGPFICSQG